MGLTKGYDVTAQTETAFGQVVMEALADTSKTPLEKSAVKAAVLQSLARLAQEHIARGEPIGNENDYVVLQEVGLGETLKPFSGEAEQRASVTKIDEFLSNTTNEWQGNEQKGVEPKRGDVGKMLFTRYSDMANDARMSDSKGLEVIRAGKHVQLARETKNAPVVTPG